MEDDVAEHDVRDTAAVVLTRPDEAELRERARAGKPPGLESVGQCPYCHHDLERRQVSQPMTAARTPLDHPSIPGKIVLMTFWACTNGECCLMFWRHPRTPQVRKFPLADDLVEH